MATQAPTERQRNVLVVSTVDHAEEVLRSRLGATDNVMVVVPVVSQGVLDWLANDERAFSHAQHVADETAAELPGETVEAHAGEADVDLAIRDALATFPADEIVIAVHPPDEQGLVEAGATGHLPERLSTASRSGASPCTTTGRHGRRTAPGPAMKRQRRRRARHALGQDPGPRPRRHRGRDRDRLHHRRLAGGARVSPRRLAPRSSGRSASRRPRAAPAPASAPACPCGRSPGPAARGRAASPGPGRAGRGSSCGASARAMPMSLMKCST